MRILTPSRRHSKGLFSISEADDDAPQEVVFCVPINKNEAREIRTLLDLSRRFSQGISTKILESQYKREIYLELDYNSQNRNDFSFATKLGDQTIAFYISDANFENPNQYIEKNRMLNISHFYEGHKYRGEFETVKFLVLQPNWRQLDELYRRTGILFADFT